MTVGFVPYIGKILCFLHICLLYSLYSFEYKWFNQGLSWGKSLHGFFSRSFFFRLRASPKINVHRKELALLHWFWIRSCCLDTSLWLVHHQWLFVLYVLPSFHHQRQRKLATAKNVRKFKFKFKNFKILTILLKFQWFSTSVFRSRGLNFEQSRQPKTENSRKNSVEKIALTSHENFRAKLNYA